MPDQFTKLTIIGILYLMLFVIEQFAPYFKNRQQHVQHSIRNIALATFNSAVSIIIYILLLKHVCDWTLENNIGLLNALNLSGVYTFFIAIILIDCWQYFWHRFNHVVPLLWRFHQVHHADKDMDASTGIRFHTVEIIYSNMARLIIIPILGLQLDHLLLYELLVLPVILFHQSNININETTDKLLRTIIVTPHMHRLHHSDIRTETDSNYASIFSMWDRLFNSYTMRSIEHDFRLGLGETFSEREWNRLLGILKIPFTKVS